MDSAITSELNDTRPKVRRVRKLLWGILAVVVTLAVLVPLVTRWYLLRTDYALGFTERAFNRLKHGDTLNTVWEVLKAPLSITVVSQREDDSRYKPQHYDEVSMLWNWTNDDSVVVILHYSRPRHPGGAYRAREVWIRKGIVQETRAYNYWD